MIYIAPYPRLKQVKFQRKIMKMFTCFWNIKEIVRSQTLKIRLYICRGSYIKAVMATHAKLRILHKIYSNFPNLAHLYMFNNEENQVQRWTLLRPIQTVFIRSGIRYNCSFWNRHSQPRWVKKKFVRERPADGQVFRLGHLKKPILLKLLVVIFSSLANPITWGSADFCWPVATVTVQFVCL